MSPIALRRSRFDWWTEYARVRRFRILPTAIDIDYQALISNENRMPLGQTSSVIRQEL